MHFRLQATVGTWLMVSALCGSAQAGSPDPARIAEIASWLEEKPAGLGPSADDRDAWTRPDWKVQGRALVARAEKTVAHPLPEQPPELFLDFARTGNRSRWQRVASQRRSRVTWLTLGECIEDKGRFLAALKDTIKALCAEPTWVMPAHDRSLGNFKGKTVDIDLGSSAVGWNLACCLSLLGDRLDEATQAMIRRNLFRRILAPYRDMVTGKRRRNWWMNTTNNWNAVCLAGVTGTALAVIEDRKDRAFFAAAAEHYIRNFLKGFGHDGYCSEGVGYWNYGFGHFMLLAETLRKASGGKVDLMAWPEVRAPAAYGRRIEIVDGICPAFADCSPLARPSAELNAYVRRRFLPGEPPAAGRLSGGNLFATLNSAFPAENAPVSDGTSAFENEMLRTWFDASGILICRPGEGGPAGFGAAMKGGNNAEHHNHNDVGSYLVVWKGRPVLADPGSEVYTSRTFSARRYESKVLNSWGHPVPVPAGRLQRAGSKAKGVVEKADFAAQRDELVIDMISAYAKAGLKKLRRTFVYDRSGTGAFIVRDEVSFDSPSSFETALITFGGWVKKAPDELLVFDDAGALNVRIDTGGQPFEIVAEKIEEDVHSKTLPTRLGIRLTDPIEDAVVTVTVTPVAPPVSKEGFLHLLNGDFETSRWGWNLPREGLGSITPEGEGVKNRVLHITDDSASAGSNVTSAPVRLGAAKRIRLRGRARVLSGSGLGMYVKFFGADGAMLNEQSGKGHISPVGSLGGGSREWQAFDFESDVPEGATTARLWIHSFNASQIEALIDDLVLEKAE